MSPGPKKTCSERNGDSLSPSSTASLIDPIAYFADMIDHCIEFAEQAKAQGRPVVGIMCEFTPREIILAAGALPACLCGGSAKTIPAAEQFLPSNLCPLIKSTFGYHVNRSNPFLEMADLVVAETTCDGKKKMFELMGLTRPMYVLELPQKAETPAALQYWTEEVRKLKTFLEQKFRVSITNEKLGAAIQLMNRERRLRRQLADLMVQDTPPLTGRQLLEYKTSISGNEADYQQMQRAFEFYSQAKVSPGSQIRVLLTGVPLVHGAERVLELIENAGGLVVCMENCTGLKPILDDVDENVRDPIAAIARKYYHLPCSVMTSNSRRLESLQALVSKFRPQCVIELVWQACLTYDVEAYHVRKFVEEQLHLPYLKITTDYSPSDSARLTSRLEALMETIRGAL